MARIIVATACDGGYDALTIDLMASLKALPTRDFAIGFVRLGDAPIPEGISSVADEIHRSDASPIDLASGEGFAVARFAIKARLPEFFPGYDVYVWLDGDTWVQNGRAIRNLIRAAGLADVAAVPEADAAYWRGMIPNNYTIETYSRIYGAEAVQHFGRFPMINGGVVAARSDSPLWARWRDELQASTERQRSQERRRYSDQIPLHRLIYSGQLTLHPLSAVNNWIVLLAPPVFETGTRTLRSPSLPYVELGILHLMGPSKRTRYLIGDQAVSYRYGEFRAYVEAIEGAS